MSIKIKSENGTVTETFKGCVVYTKWDSVRVMSDIWEQQLDATVFDNSDGTFKKIFVCGEETGLSSQRNEAVVDATPEILELYESHKYINELEQQLAKAKKQHEDAIQELRTPAKGKTLRVVKGRKFALGLTGTCTWYGRGQSFVRGQEGEMRVGMEVDGKVEWIAARNVEVVIG